MSSQQTKDFLFLQLLFLGQQNVNIYKYYIFFFDKLSYRNRVFGAKRKNQVSNTYKMLSLRSSCRRFYSTAPKSTTETVQKLTNLSLRDPSYKIPEKAVIYSGIQPTGQFHLGNYLGAVRVWQDLCHKVTNEGLDSKLIFFVADLHSLTVPQDYPLLRQQRIEALASIIACGVNPDDATIFYQSSVPEHTQLNWILSCYTGMGILNRMTQWKSKANISDESDMNSLGSVKLGLFSYPVLMAADVLLYNATHVPVGLDQSQHLELTREVAQAFNKSIKKEYFKIPKTLLAPTSKILSLKTPSKKMSKSDKDELSKIFISEDEKAIRKKINKATTDSIEGKITYDPIERPGVSNLINMVSAIERESIETVTNKVEDFSKKELKDYVATVLVKELEEPRRKYEELMKDPEHIQRLSEIGRDQARAIASKNIKKIYELVGML